jgi:hypothetical protein
MNTTHQHNPQNEPVNELVAKQSETLRRRIDKDQEKNAHKRKFQRHPTFAVSTLMLLDNSHVFDGVVTEVSAGGVKFRPASSFLQERNGDRVSIKIDEIQSTGVIRASRADGYGIQLLDKLPQEAMEFILQNYGVEN